MSKTVPMIRSSICSLALCALAAPLAAGEIYGRVAKDGRVYANASVTIKCNGFSDSQTTNSSGAYRSSGPSGEQQCQLSVSGAGNTVAVYTSQGRTRANLELKGNRLYRR